MNATATQESTAYPRDQRVELWGDGPWVDEPDRVEFYHAGLPCLMRRTDMGAWCGYVAVPPGHGMHGIPFGVVDQRVWAHGGLTYSKPCESDICHEPRLGEPDDVWWLGFDCAHWCDVVPALEKRMVERMGPRFATRSDDLPDEFTPVYRDRKYVEANVRVLAVQLARLADFRFPPFLTRKKRDRMRRLWNDMRRGDITEGRALPHWNARKMSDFQVWGILRSRDLM